MSKNEGSVNEYSTLETIEESLGMDDPPSQHSVKRKTHRKSNLNTYVPEKEWVTPKRYNEDDSDESCPDPVSSKKLRSLILF